MIAAAAPHGLAALHGFSAGVGVAGYVLGGGLGWLARGYGLASDHVRVFEVVTAGGERRRVDARWDRDLFWALRGGGGAGGDPVDPVPDRSRSRLLPSLTPLRSTRWSRSRARP